LTKKLFRSIVKPTVARRLFPFNKLGWRKRPSKFFP